MSTTYQPGQVPDDPKGVLGWLIFFLRTEFASINRALEAPQPFAELQYLTAEPARSRPGMVVLADGVAWNPGSGEGAYRRDLANAAWVHLG